MKRTHKLWKSASWALATAGAVGWGAEAAAQSPYRPVSVGTSPVTDTWHQRGRLVDARLTADAPTRTVLAWLAERALFPYPLAAQVAGSALEITGSLPDENSHALALKIAREQSGMQVRDGIRVDPSCQLPPFTKPASALTRDVTDALAQAVPASLDSITVSVWTNGQVLLKGKTTTSEEKLRASRCLKQVPGCRCVVNQLEASRSATPVSAPAPEKKAIGIGLPIKQEPAKVEQPKTMRLGMPGKQEPAKVEQPKFVQTIGLGGPIPVSAVEPRKMPAVPVVETVAIAESRPLSVSRMEMSAPAPMPASVSPYHPQTQSIGDSRPIEPGAPGVDAPASAPASLQRSTVSTGSSPLAYHATRWRRLERDGSVRRAAPAPVPPGATGVIQVAAEKPVTAPAASEGMIFFNDTETLPQAQPMPVVRAQTRTLQLAVARACGKAVSDVEIIPSGGSEVIVRIKARTTAECDRFAQTIAGMAELAPYHTTTEFSVAP